MPMTRAERQAAVLRELTDWTHFVCAHGNTRGTTDLDIAWQGTGQNIRWLREHLENPTGLPSIQKSPVHTVLVPRVAYTGLLVKVAAYNKLRAKLRAQRQRIRSVRRGLYAPTTTDRTVGESPSEPGQ